MNVTTRKTEEIRITNPETSEVTVVTMTDEAPGKGRLTVGGGGHLASCFWNNMGGSPIREYFLASTDAFIVGCLDPFGTLFRKIDPKKLAAIVVADIAVAENLDDAQKLSLTARTREFDPISDVNGLQVLNGDLMNAIYGPMWVNQVSERFLGQHPTYTGLVERIALIRSVLAG